MKLNAEYEWGIIIFGENNKGRITHEMMRSFADVFRAISFKLGLNLVQSPLFLFTRNVAMVQKEVEEWFEELEKDENEMLVLLFNDSDSTEVEEKMQGTWREKVLIYIQKSDSLLRCARDKTEEIIICWINEICGLLSRRFYESSENEGEYISGDLPLFDFTDVANIFTDLQKLEKPPKDLDLVKYIDNPRLHNRLRIPFTEREQNGRLLAILSAASFTELPDLQVTVVNFVEKILKSGFISFMLRENAYCIHTITSDECYRTLFTYLQDIMQILYISRINHVQDFDIVCNEFLNFMELIPEKCWSAIDEGSQLAIFRMLQKLTIDTSNSLTDLHEDHELNIIYNDNECFDHQITLDLSDSIENFGHKNDEPVRINNDGIEPPEDFRTLSVYATSNDILQPVQPYIRRNIIRGNYSCQEHYLDVQFRLMREDLVGPLRDGIKLWREQKGKESFLSYAVDACEELDILIVRGVTVEGAQLKRSTGEIIRYVIFQPMDTDSLWTSRLKYGQLITMSSDGFQNEALLATIVEKDSDDFSKGKLGLCFFDDHSVSRGKIYTLIESSSYYEMYQHVLERIKRFDDDHRIPFERFLLKAETDVKLPSYLVQQIDEDSHSSSDSLNSEYTDYSDSPSAKKSGIAKEISIFGTKYTMDKLKYTLDGDKVACGLDNAQRNALCYALMHELALIQGPPGTGKTFLGRLIVRILLENMNMWNPERINPMLVVCFTNHALDQFLDGILVDLKEDGRYNNEFPSIVRFGSRCKSETLQRYTKRPVLEEYANLISDREKHKANQVILKRIHLLQKIRSAAAILTLRKSKILSVKYIQHAMLPEHIQQFNMQRQSGGKGCSMDEIFCRWLLEGDAGREDCVSVEGDTNEKIIECEEKKFSESESPELSALWSMDEIFVKEKKNEQREKMLESVSQMDEWLTWKKMQERLLRTNPDIDDYYHTGEWDLNKDATAVENVTIFSDHGKSKQRTKAKCNAELIARLEDVKDDILKSSPLTLEEASSIKNLQTLHRHRRWALYMHWISKLKVFVTKKLDILICKYQTLMEDVNKEYDHLDEIILRKALIIGATTTCAAKIKPFLDRLGCPIVIVEEAAEVLEAHVLTSITDKCQHAILIGDHQQLRPNTAVFALAREYNLDISLFERLIKNNFPYATLEKQHRMATAISNTIMPEFYPLMKDADNVLSYPNVEGCRKNLYFINQCHEEDVFFSTSHKNLFEADFMVNLSAYFVQQGYACSQITLLCAYTAQANCVRTKVMLKFNSANFPLVETIDNYQGRENDIIILSLVRSQPSDGVGFLRVHNRVCVALSRSKFGLYMIGNMHFLKSNSQLWNRLCTALTDAHCIGDGFPAFCAKHNVTQMIYNADEFLTKTPEGGCYRSCDFVQPCGHICGQLCHRTDPEHKALCTHSCPKMCSTVFQHPCTRLCGESCGACQYFENKLFPCGHTTGVVCHLFEEAVCQQKCDKILPCGYKCVKKCNEPCKCLHEVLLNCGHTVTACCSEKQKTKCSVEVEKTFATCNHHWTVLCHNYEDARCGEKCDRILSCGHRCQSLCGNCTLEGCASCMSLCGKRLPCGHDCLRTCGIPCDPCIASCSNQCGHLHCGQQFNLLEEQRARCADFCSFCVQRCMNSCKHQKCQMQCWQICNITPCSFSCDKKLECGHICLSPCGEICPDVCAECQGINVPILQFQGCKCIVSVEEADLHIREQKSSKQQYTCPKCACKLPANACFRYARELKEQIINNEKIKFAKLLTDGLFISSHCDILKQAEDDLVRIMRIKRMKKNAAATEIAEILDLVITRLNAEFYSYSGVMKWQVMVNMLSDMCRLAMYITTEKFTSIPRKRSPNLHKLFHDSLGTTNNIFPVLETDLLNLLAFAKLLKTESPSMLEIPISNGLRKVSIKYMLGRLANDFIRKLKDLEICQLNGLLEITIKALDWSSDAEQKKASIRFVQYYRDLYEVLNMQHMLINDLQCMNFPC
ncbi:AAA domain family protein [Acanthocheilonema viteae]